MLKKVKTTIGIIYAIWLGEMIKFWRSKSIIISAISAPLTFMIFLAPGFISGFKFRGGGDIDTGFFTPGLIGISVYMISIFSSVSIVWDREFGTLKAILIAPVSRFSLALGKAVSGVTMALMQGILIMIIAILFGTNYVSFIGILAGIIVMSLSGIGFVGLGIALASKIESQDAFQMIMSFLTMPLIMLSGAFFPIADLPAWLKSLVYINPLTYSIDALRWSLLGGSTISILSSITVITLFAIIMVGIAGRFFEKMSVDR